MKKRELFLFFILFLILLNSINAQNEAPFQAIDKGIIISPPPPPEEDISEKYVVIFELKGYDSKNLINDLHIDLEIINKETDKKTSTLKYIGEDGLVRLLLSKGVYDITLKVDKIETNGRDYFIKFDQSVINNVSKTVYLMSVGSVLGNIYSEKGNAVKGAQIKVQCSGNYGEKENIISDRFGSFNLYWLPVGSCRISSMYGNKVGYKDVIIKKGELSNIDLTLSTGILSKFNFGSIVILIIIAIVVMLVGKSYVTKKKKEVKKETIKEETKEKVLSSRTKDVIKTFKEKEKAIVNFLLENNNKSTQAKIHYAVGIPKTSLARILQGLELKKIVKIEKVGKVKKVELTDWFIGKE